LCRRYLQLIEDIVKLPHAFLSAFPAAVQTSIKPVPIAYAYENNALGPHRPSLAIMAVGAAAYLRLSKCDVIALNLTPSFWHRSASTCLPIWD
jgi:hypothetical protein